MESFIFPPFNNYKTAQNNYFISVAGKKTWDWLQKDKQLYAYHEKFRNELYGTSFLVVCIIS